MKLVTLKYTQYGGEGYLRGGDEGVACEGQLLFSTDSRVNGFTRLFFACSASVPGSQAVPHPKGVFSSQMTPISGVMFRLVAPGAKSSIQGFQSAILSTQLVILSTQTVILSVVEG